jgi:hypothetical protein
MRGMCAAILSFEALILGLSTPVMIGVEGIAPGVALPIGLGLAALCIVTAGALRRPQAYLVGHAIQVASILLGLVVPIMFFIGGLFAALWAGAYLLGRRIEADKARWAAEAGEDPPG